MSKVRIAVLISGGGTNLQSIIDAVDSGELDLQIACVVSNRKEAFGLKRAENAGIPAYYVGKGNYPEDQERETALLNLLEKKKIDLIVLAGYLNILPSSVIGAYKDRIINIHPSLIPRHCGKGFYGMKVHESVISSGDAVTGVTIHYVDEGVDTGKVIERVEIPVFESDMAESLSKRVLVIEHELLVRVLKDLIENFGGRYES
ncbi:MAG: phosphoribosylglycinamide formyltransferase [Clostridia bacterium]|nr:phosphoribosylglycinamide formyltransferase [Clostridia bacterium]